MRRRNTKATTLIHDGSSSKLRYIKRDGDARFFVSDIWSMATQPIPTGSELKKYFLKCEFWLILPEVTAIEVRLSHASRM